jgi:hypothetical protein
MESGKPDMGAWGAGPFENDDAADFLDSLETARNSRTFIARTLRQAAKSRAYLELPESAGAWAAAELVAALRGNGIPAARSRLSFVMTKITPPELQTLAEFAKAAITRLDRDCELADVCREAGQLAELEKSFADLQRRLSKPRTNKKGGSGKSTDKRKRTRS